MATECQIIQKVVAEYYMMSPERLLSSKRIREVVRPRQIAMRLVSEMTRMSLPAIGMAFSYTENPDVGRDHTTVMHARTRIADLEREDWRVRDDLAVLRQAVKAKLERRRLERRQRARDLNRKPKWRIHRLVFRYGQKRTMRRMSLFGLTIRGHIGTGKFEIVECRDYNDYRDKKGIGKFEDPTQGRKPKVRVKAEHRVAA